MATSPRKDLPNPSAPNWGPRVTEELRVLMGRAGNGRALTSGDLISAGIAKPAPGGGLLPGEPGDQEPNLTPPPMPTGFLVHAAISNIGIEHDFPVYPQGHGHGMTVVYGVMHREGDPLPTFDVAVELMRFSGSVGSYPTNPATAWRLWIKWLSNDGVLSVSPAGGINGLLAVTGQDVQKLLEVLQGQLSESQLHQDLAKEIELISGAGVGSVNARLIAEAQARAQAVALEAQARAQAVALEAQARAQDLAAEAQTRAADLAAEAQARGQGISGEAQARAAAVQAEAAAREAALAQVTADLQAASSALQGNIDAVNAQVADIIGAGEYDAAKAYESGQLVKRQGKLYRSKSAVPAGNPPPAAAYWVLVGDYDSIGEAVAAHAAQLSDHSVRIGQTEQGLTAEASSRNALAVQLRGNYTGADLGQVTSGLVWSERQARVTGDSANASAIQAVSARMPSGTGAVAAAADVVAEQQARVAGDGANATAIQAVTARMPAGSGKVATEASVTDETTARASGDSALASRAALIEARLPAGTGQLATSAQVVAEEQARVAGDSANASLIQGVRTDLTSTQGTVAGQGTAINGLQSSVTSINGALTSQAGSITQLQASVGAASTGLQALNALGTESEWRRISGPPLSTKAEASAKAGSVLVMGANSGGNDAGAFYHSVFMPLDEDRLYKFSARYRRVAGTGRIYLGLAGMNAAKSQFVTSGNVETVNLTNGHYAVNNVLPALGEWTSYEGYFKGRAAAASTGTGAKASPIAVANKVAHVAFIFLGNYSAASGTYELDYITLDDVTDVERVSSDVTTEAAARAAADGALATRATNLEARMPAGTGQLATAAALTTLETRVASTEGVNTSQGTSITSLNNSLNALEGAGDNLLKSSNVEKVRADGAYSFATFGTTETLEPGTTYTLVTCATHAPAAGDTSSYVAAYVDGVQILYPAAVKNGANVITVATFVRNAGGAGNRIIYYYFPSSVKTGAATVHWACLYKGAVVPPKAWQPSVAELASIVGTKADSSALTALTSTVTGQGDTISSQGTSLAALTNKVNHATTGLDAKASSAALATLDSKVTTQGSTITSQGTAITNLQNDLDAVEGDLATKASSAALSALQSTVTQQGSTLTSQGSSLTTLTNSLSGLQVGGANLYNLKSGTQANEAGAATVVWLTDDHMRLTCTAVNASNNRMLIRFDSSFVATDHTIAAGKIYSVSFEILSPVAGGVSFYTYIGGSGPIFARPIVLPAENQWVRVVVEGVVAVGATITGSSVMWALNVNSVGLVGKAFEVRNLQVEPGNKATAFRRAAAVTQADINSRATSAALGSLQSTVTGQGDAITSQGLSLTSLTNKVNHATTGLDAKASSAALASLDSKVTTQGETITSQGTALTTLTNNLSALSGVVDSKASSAALSALQSTVTEQGGALTSQGSSITSLAQSLETAAAVAAIGSVHIGAIEPFGGRRNLHSNPSFELTGVQNMIATYSGAIATLEQSPSAAAGNAVLQVVRGATGTGLFGMIYALPAPSGTAFSARFKIRLKPGTPSRSIFITAASYINGSGGSWAKIGTGNGSRTLTDQWQEVVFAGFTQSASNNAAGLQLASNGTWAAGDGVQIDMVLAEAAENPGVWFNPFDMLWIDTTGGANTPKRWNGAAWIGATDKVATDAAAAAAAAQATANTKADASALASLQSTVTQQGTTITSQGGSITSLNNSITAVDRIVTSQDTRNVNSPPSYYWTNYPRRTVREFKNRVVIGAPGTGTYGSLETTAAWTDASGGPITQVFTLPDSMGQYSRYSTSTTAWSAWENAVRDLQTVVGTKADATAVQALTNRVTAAEGVNTSHGTSITSLTNRITDVEGVNAGQASSIGTLDSRVTLAEGKIEAQASSVTSLASSLASTRDSSSLLPDYLSANAGEWRSHYGTVLAPFFKTTTTGKIGPNVVRKEGILNFWNYSKTSLPNDRAYRLLMWVRRSADATGSCFFNADRIGPNGAGIGETYVAITSQITADGEWCLVSSTWDLRSQAAIAPRLCFGFAINHGQANGWAEMQGFKVTEVLSAADLDASVATAAALTSLTTRVASTEAMNTSQSTSIISLTNSLSSLSAVVDTKASSSALSTLDSKVTQQGNTITSIGSSLTSLTNTIDNSSTGLASKASATAVSSLDTRVTSTEGLISSHTTQINQVQATAAGNSSAIQQNASAQADINGYVAAQYSMKVQVASNGKTAVGGMAVQGTSNGTAGPTIDFGVMASTFWVAAPAGSGLTSANLFIVRTAATTINGQPVPAGTYFTDAFIGNGTITSAKIGKLQVDDGHVVSLSVGKLVAGSLAVGQYMQSTSYVAGSAGWRINANGTAEFSGVIVRGTIHATAGTIGTFSINENGLNSGGYVGYGWPNGNATGVHISHRGILIGNPNTGKYIQITETGEIYTPHFVINSVEAIFGGRLNAASGVFSGSLSAVNGTFSGTLTAANIVNTGHVVPNAITVPVAVQGHTASIYMESAGQVTVLVFFSPVQVPVNGTIRITRNGFTIYNQSIIAGTPEQSGTAMLIDSPGAGTHTYTIRFGELLINQVNMLLLGTKR